MNVLNALGSCCGDSTCNNCPSVTPFAWDCLGLLFSQNSVELRRFCPVTLPLARGIGGYTAGQVVPFWQPQDVGPPLTETGAYGIEATRRPGLFFGTHGGNTEDDTTPPENFEAGGSKRFEFNGDYQWTPFQGGWGNYPIEPLWVRVLPPEADGTRYVIAACAFIQNGDLGAIENVWVFNLKTGVGKTYTLTHGPAFGEEEPEDPTLSYQAATDVWLLTAGTLAKLTASSLWMPYELSPSGRSFKYNTASLVDTTPQGGWIYNGQDAAFAEGAGLAGGGSTNFGTVGRHTVGYCREDASRRLVFDVAERVEVGAGPGGSDITWYDTEIVSVKTGEPDLVLYEFSWHAAQSPLLNYFPTCYHCRDGRHVLLLSAQDGDEYTAREYIDTHGANRTLPAGTPEVFTLPGSAKYTHLLLGPEDEIAVAGPTRVARIAPDRSEAWGQAVSLPAYANQGGANAELTFALKLTINLTREHCNAWYQVRGVAIDSTSRGTVPASDPEITANNQPYATSFAIHPAGPSSGVTLHRQKGEQAFPGGGGSRDIHLLGDYVAGWNTASDKSENAGGPSYAHRSTAEFAGTPGDGLGITGHYAHGLGSAPLPATHAPDGEGAY